MSFEQKSTTAMTVILIAVFGWYFILVLGVMSDSPDRDLAYRGLMVPVVILLVILAAGSHAVLALMNPREATAPDERDRMIGLRGGQVGGGILAVGVVAGIGLAMTSADRFWIAQTLIAALVLAEVGSGAMRLVLYGRGI